MPIVSISRDSYSHGQEIAEAVSRRLGAECVGREAVLQAAEAEGIDQKTMIKALSDAPSFLERLSRDKKRHVTFFKAALLRRLQSGNVVYHGLAGHVFLAGLEQAMKVRIVADFEERVHEEMRREHISEEDARAHLSKTDRERREWCRHLYGVDSHDTDRYDLSINLTHTSIEDAVEQIVVMARNAHFKMTAAAMATLNDMTVAADAEAQLLQAFSDVSVSSREGAVYVTLCGPVQQELLLSAKAEAMLQNVPGVSSMYVGVSPEACVEY